MSELTADRLRELLRYDADVGEFFWRVALRNGRPSGSRAGSRQAEGYRQIRVDKRRYYEHRLAWLYVHGVWPPDQIDHIDGNKQNNAIANLRAATPSQNHCNRPKSKNNTSGFKGVSWFVPARRWKATMRRHGRSFHIGYYSTPEEAGAAYAEAARLRDGEFARTE